MMNLAEINFGSTENDVADPLPVPESPLCDTTVILWLWVPVDPELPDMSVTAPVNPTAAEDELVADVPATIAPCEVDSDPPKSAPPRRVVAVYAVVDSVLMLVPVEPPPDATCATNEPRPCVCPSAANVVVPVSPKLLECPCPIVWAWFPASADEAECPWSIVCVCEGTFAVDNVMFALDPAAEPLVALPRRNASSLMFGITVPFMGLVASEMVWPAH